MTSTTPSNQLNASEQRYSAKSETDGPEEFGYDDPEAQSDQNPSGSELSQLGPVLAKLPKDSEMVVSVENGYRYQRKSDYQNAIEDIAVFLETPISSHRLTVKDLILREEVPITTCLVVATGLPNSGKTTALESTFRGNIHLKKGAKYLLEHYLNRKKNERCLSVYELCVLGGAPCNQFQWSFATNRCGAVFSILHVLARRHLINNQHIDIKSLFDEHVHWLVEAVTSQMKSIEPEKLELIQDGLSLINVMDVGLNKALYEFLQTVISCRRHIRLAFFSLDRDAPNLHEPPELPHDRYGERKDDVIMMKQGPRFGYLVHFATLGYKKDRQNNTTVMMATSTKTTPNPQQLLRKAREVIEPYAKSQGVHQYIKSWEIVNADDKDQIKDIGRKIQELIKDTYYSKVNIPLRWIILRSLVTSLEKGNSKAIIMKKSFIIKQADNFKMNGEEVEKFLITFADFGSILYMPQLESLKDIVIIDIYEFTQCIDRLFYPKPEATYSQNLLKYGIISQVTISQEIVPLEILDDFITILTKFAMVAKIESPSRILINQEPFQSEVKTHFYLPSARVGNKYDTLEDENCVVLHIEGADFPSGLQAGISHEIMKNEEAFLIATEDCNTSQFLFRYKEGFSIEIQMIYRVRSTHLRINSNSVDVLKSSEAIDACSKALTATFKCLQSITQALRGVTYSIAIPCSKSSSEYHYLYRSHRSNLCETCKKSKEEFRFCWSSAAEKCLPHLTYDMSINESHISNKFEIEIPTLKSKTQQQERITSLEKQSIKETSSVGVQFNSSMDNLECLSIDGLSDVQVAEKKLFLIQGDKPQLMNWEKYGLRIEVQEGSLLSSETVEAAVVAFVGGQFQFPPNTVLVSAVYAVSLSNPLLKQLKLEIQHCVDLTGRPDLAQYLKFAIAPVNTPSLPYQFSIVEGGEFSSNSWYGSIQRKEFSFTCILGEEWTDEGGNGVPQASVTGNTKEGEEEEEEQQSRQEENEEEDEFEAIQHKLQEKRDEEGNEDKGDDDDDSSSDSSGVTSKTNSIPEASGAAKEPINEEKEFKRNEDKEHSSSTELIPHDEDTKTQSTGVKEATTYSGLVYYEEDGVKDLVIFTAVKKLNTLLEFIEKKRPQAKLDLNVYFRIASPNGFVELNLNAPQDEPFTGWSIKPHTTPCRLFQKDIYNFGNEDYPLPPSCRISVYSSPDAVPTLHYSVPVEGVADPLTLNIHRTRRTSHPIADVPSASSSDEAKPVTTKRRRAGSTCFDIKTAKQKIKQVMNENHSDFADILESSLKDIANKLFEAKIVAQQVQKSPTYDAIASSFLSLMKILDSKSALEKHCMMFLEALSSVGGPIERVAECLQEKWTAALGGALQFEQSVKRVRTNDDV